MRVRFTVNRRLRRWIIIAALGLAVWTAYQIFWPSYSWQEYIDPDDVRVAAIMDAGQNYEVHRHRSPRLLKRLVAALNGARRRYPQPRLAPGDGSIIVQRSKGWPVRITYGAKGRAGAILFRDNTGYPGSFRILWRSRALGRVLKAIRKSRECRTKRPRIPLRSVASIALYGGGGQKTVAGASSQTHRVVKALNQLLSSVDTTFYSLRDDPSENSFYRGEVDLYQHLSGTTGALLMLDPPLSMHTNMMHWMRQSGPCSEYQEFKTSMILISDAITVKGVGKKREKVVGFSSDAKANRFYLFDPDGPVTPEEESETAEKWGNVIQAIEGAIGTGGSGRT